MNTNMRGLITCVLLGSMAAAGSANGLSLYKCILLDGSGVVYQDQEPNSTECRIEKKEFDPDANVIPYPKSTGVQQSHPGSKNSSQSTSGIPDEETRQDVLITGEEEGVGAEDLGKLPGRGTSTTPSTATGIIAPAAPVAPGGAVGP